MNFIKPSSDNRWFFFSPYLWNRCYDFALSVMSTISTSWRPIAFFFTGLVVWVPKMCVHFFFLIFIYFLFRWMRTLVASSDRCPMCRKMFKQPHAEAQAADVNFTIRIAGVRFRSYSIRIESSLFSIVLSLTHLSAFWFLSLSPSYSFVRNNTLKLITRKVVLPVSILIKG